MYDEHLVLDNENLIYYVLKKMNLYNKTEELFDIGMIGLVKAARKFDSTKGFVFNTYAYSCIHSEILQYLRSKNTEKRKANYNTISLDTPVYSNGTDGEITLEERLPSHINVEEEIIKQEEINRLYKALSKLKEREKQVLIYTYGLYGKNKLTQHRLKESLGISQAQVSRIKNKAIKKLRKILQEEI